MNLRDEQVRRLRAQADGLLAQGRHAGAIAAYRKALEYGADAPDVWFNLGYALRQEGAFEEALRAYGEALRHGVAHPEEVHLNRAAIHADHLRRDHDAEAELRAALAIVPDYAPALLNLGNLHEERGQRDDATACYQHLLSLPPAEAGTHAYRALARLAQLRPPADAGDPLLQRIRSAAQDPSPIDDSTRADLYFSLGRASDALGDHAAAFRDFEAGKHVAHRRYPAYDPGREERRTKALIEAFAAPAARRPGTHAPAPLFICGMFRSGSTLLEQALAAHPDVAAAGELDLLPRMVSSVLKPFPASIAPLDDVRFRQLADAYHARMKEQLPRHGEGKTYATDKRPDNYLLIGLIKLLFPDARILHTTRHPLDNGLSVFMQHLNPRVFAYAGTLAGIGHHHGQYARLMSHWKRLYPDDIIDFDYDAFVAAPEATLRPLLESLGLRWQPGCLAFHQLRNTVKTASYWQVRRPLYSEASGRWRRYHAHLGPLIDALTTQGIDPCLAGPGPGQASVPAR